MKNINDELKEKVLAAKSEDEVLEILKEAGQEVTEEDLSHLWEEINLHGERDGKELSVEELEAVSGGYDRNWVTDGCAATVEYGSQCFTNDACYKWDVVYKNSPSWRSYCPFCNASTIALNHTYFPEDFVYGWYCRNCGLIGHRYYDEKDIRMGFNFDM